MDNNTWILVADASQAKIYSTHKVKLFQGNGKQLTLVGEFQHENSRKKDIDLISDRQGQFGSGTFVEPTDPKRHEEELFAIELARTLTKARAENLYHELIFIAPATFMGLISKHLSNDIQKLINLKVEKEYTRLTENELVMHLREYL